MWPLDLPAREVLKLPGETVIAWAVFDWQWYLRTLPRGRRRSSATTIRRLHLNTTWNLGRSRAIRPTGCSTSQWHGGCTRRSPNGWRLVTGGPPSMPTAGAARWIGLPHWLFEELGYRDRYPDLTNEVLAEFQIFNGYDHYLRHGSHEDRIGHVLFDPIVYLSNFDPADVPAIRQDGVFQHYLNRIESAEPELRTSIYFDPEWYVKRYPEVARGIESKQWKCALHHYLCNDSPTAFDPSASFSESWYLQRDPGSAGAHRVAKFS